MWNNGFIPYFGEYFFLSDVGVFGTLFRFGFLAFIIIPVSLFLYYRWAKMLHPDTGFVVTATLAQLVIWDARRIMAHQHACIRATLGALHADWLLNLVSIDEQRSYFLADNDATRDKVAQALAVEFADGHAPYERLILRKELMRMPAFAAGG